MEGRFSQRQGAGGAAQAGDAFRISSGGGGGYGEPFERPIEDVREDVRQGYVSVQKPRPSCMAPSSIPKTFAVDEAASAELRTKLSAKREAAVDHEPAARSRRRDTGKSGPGSESRIGTKAKHPG